MSVFLCCRTPAFAFLFVAAGHVAAGCVPDPIPPFEPPSDTGLKSLARARGLTIGSQFNPADLAADSSLEGLLLHEVDLVIPGNDFKMRLIHPQKDTFHFDTTDGVLDWAEEHDLEVHGHTLMWDKSLPAWVEDGSWTREQLIEVLENHISTVVGRYRGRVAAWDVVNEAFCDPAVERDCIVESGESGGMDPSIWRTVIGPDAIELALRAARAADPDAKLYINDNGYELPDTAKALKLYSYVEDLVARGVPLDGVGIQMHWALDEILSASQRAEGKQAVATLFQKLNDLGLEVRITELDVRLPQDRCASEDFLAGQADAFALALEVCLEAASCPSFNMWGLTDRYSWIPDAKPGYDCATPFDEEYVAKPAYFALSDTLQAE